MISGTAGATRYRPLPKPVSLGKGIGNSQGLVGRFYSQSRGISYDYDHPLPFSLPAHPPLPRTPKKKLFHLLQTCQGRTPRLKKKQDTFQKPPTIPPVSPAFPGPRSLTRRAQPSPSATAQFPGSLPERLHSDGHGVDQGLWPPCRSGPLEKGVGSGGEQREQSRAPAGLFGERVG